MFIKKKYLKRNFGVPDLSWVIRIIIDEITVKKGPAGNLTFAMDLEPEIVIHVDKGKGNASLDMFLKRLKKSEARTECVSVN